MTPKLETITLKDREIRVEVDVRPVTSLQLDLANPRYSHLGPVESEKDLEAQIWGQPETKELYQSIKANRGLITPLYVRQDDLVVEGNRRLTCLRHLARQLEVGKEDAKLQKIVDKVPVRVFPAEFSPAERAVYLAYEHVTGKKPWPAMNEAYHIWDMNHNLGFTVEQLASLLGKSKTYIHQKLWSFAKTKEYFKFNPKDKDVQRYAYFEEFYKKRGPLGYSEKDSPEKAKEMLLLVFGGIQEGLFNVDKARDMRRLPEVLADDDARDAFTKGATVHGKSYKGMEAALRVLEERYPSTPAFTSITNALDALKRIPHAEYREIPDHARKVELLFTLRDRLEEIIEELDLKLADGIEDPPLKKA